MPEEKSETVKPLELNGCLTIIYSGDKTLELVCPPRSLWKALRSKFVELQSIWLQNGFSTADTIADDHAWELMSEIAELLPRKDNPAVYGFDLEPLQTDVLQLEQLFFAQNRDEIFAYRSTDEEGKDFMVFNFYIDVFRGCKILELCRYESRLVLQDALVLWKKRKDEFEKGHPNPIKQGRLKRASNLESPREL